MTENYNDENKLITLNEHKFDPTFHFINYNSSNLAEENYKYDSITNKLIEVILRIIICLSC